jgi:pilus assembly protein CpaB
MMCAFTYLSTMRAADKRQAETELAAVTQTVRAIVSTRDLPRGTRISKNDIKQLESVQAYLPNDVILNSNQAIGHETVADIFAGEPLVSRRLSGHKANRASSMIRSGRLALAVGVDEVAGVAGGIRPGDWVDVFVSEAEGGRTRRLFRGVRVLGIAGRYPFTEVDEIKDGMTEPELNAGAAVVLELRPSEASELTAASQNGDIRLALRADR